MNADWTPDQPLRADATDKQIGKRVDHIWNVTPHGSPEEHTRLLGAAEGQAAREFAAACVAAERDRIRRDFDND